MYNVFFVQLILDNFQSAQIKFSKHFRTVADHM